MRTQLQRRELVRSLATTDIRTAKIFAGRLYTLSEEIFEAASSPLMLTTDQLARLVQDFYSYVLDRENEFRLGLQLTALLPQAMPEEVRAKRHAFYSDMAQRTKASLAKNQLEDAQLVAEALARKHNLSDLDASTRNQIRQAVLRAGVDLSEALAARYSGDFTYQPKDPLLTMRIAGLDEPPRRVEEPDTDAIVTSSRSKEKRPDTPISPTGAAIFSAIQQSFRDEQLTVGAWDKQTAAQAGATYRLFIEVCGDRPLAAYTRKDAGRFKDLIGRLPAEYGKAALFRGQTVEGILKIHAAQPLAKRSATISQKTVKRHFSALSQLWTAALPKAEVTENIFLGFRFGNGKRAIDQRSMWEPKDLEQLFATPIWSGCLSESRRSTPGTLIIRDEKFWLPLVALFSGMRQEEICQLYVEDAREERGIHYFDLNNRPPRRLKNANAIRQVPIHAELIRLGILYHVAAQKRSGKDRLFPNLAPGGADDRLGHAFTKWFTRYRRDVGLYKPGLDFHSFRHTATTLLHHAGVQDSVIDRLTGHATPGETARYTKSTSLEQLQSAIERIPVLVDLSRLHH